MAKQAYTVVSIYNDNQQPYVDWVKADGIDSACKTAGNKTVVAIFSGHLTSLL